MESVLGTHIHSVCRDRDKRIPAEFGSGISTGKAEVVRWYRTVRVEGVARGLGNELNAVTGSVLSRWSRILPMTIGSSTVATIFVGPPQAWQMSMLNTRLSRCAHVMAARCSAGVWSCVSSDKVSIRCQVLPFASTILKEIKWQDLTTAFSRWPVPRP